MFHHVKELQFDARVSQPDPRFASLLLEQFGGPNGELKAAMQYFVQAFAARKPYPDKYDLLMDIATEELSHLEIVGATVTMLLDGVNGELKSAAEQSELMKLLEGKASRESMLHSFAPNNDLFANAGGGPTMTNSVGVPWSGAYVNANGDLTVDLRSNIAAESRAKIVYEYLLHFTDDPDVRQTLRFLMTREIAHFQMFQTALETIESNFPPGVLQGDPRYTHTYFNMSNGSEVRGPWNQGQGPWPQGQHWQYVADPLDHVRQTQGEIDAQVEPSQPNPSELARKESELGQQRSEEIKRALSTEPGQWSHYDRR